MGMITTCTLSSFVGLEAPENEEVQPAVVNAVEVCALCELRILNWQDDETQGKKKAKKAEYEPTCTVHVPVERDYQGALYLESVRAAYSQVVHGWIRPAKLDLERIMSATFQRKWPTTGMMRRILWLGE